MGPILGFRSTEKGIWSLSLLLLTSAGDAPKSARIKVSGQDKDSAPPKEILRFSNQSVSRYDFTVEMRNDQQKVSYDLGAFGKKEFFVPGRGSYPRLAYASCNGFSEMKAMKKLGNKNERWQHLLSKHLTDPFHLLLMGGDQLYTDGLWDLLPRLREWAETDRCKRLTMPFTPQMREDLEQFFFDTYRERWAQAEPAEALASIPCLMMWDDHDIFDGWGSHPAEEQACPVFQGIFSVAQRYFRAFQMMLADGETHPASLGANTGFSLAHSAGPLAIAALDLRSQRSIDQVLSPAAWDTFFQWADSLKGPKHFLLLSSIPVVHPNFSLVESFLGVLPQQQELEDDLRDHWHSRRHKQERMRLIHRLLRIANAGCRVTILSGDVHLAALGVIETARAEYCAITPAVINQLTSSGIVHPPPPAVLQFAMETLMSRPEEVDRGISARMLELPGSNRRFMARRNWLSLTGDGTDRLWAEWHFEGDAESYTKVIHPVA